VAGWVSLPPTDYKADWNDYHQQNGLEAATAAFNDSMYQIQGEAVKPQLQAIEGGKTDHPEKDPLKPHIESRKDGVFWVTPKVDKESGEIINAESWLCSPMEVIGTDATTKISILLSHGWHSVQAYRQQRLSRWLILASVKAGAP
jgi:putative DNA primase/helicase